MYCPVYRLQSKDRRRYRLHIYSNLFDRENIEMKEASVWEKENSLNSSRSLKFG